MPSLSALTVDRTVLAHIFYPFNCLVVEFATKLWLVEEGFVWLSVSTCDFREAVKFSAVQCSDFWFFSSAYYAADHVIWLLRDAGVHAQPQQRVGHTTFSSIKRDEKSNPILLGWDTKCTYGSQLEHTVPSKNVLPEYLPKILLKMSLCGL